MRNVESASHCAIFETCIFFSRYGDFYQVHEEEILMFGR